MEQNGFPFCEVCLENFSSKSVIPLVLPCGHSFCEKCLNNFYEQKRHCPKCRKCIKRRLTSIPKNYSLIEASRAYTNKGISKMNIDYLECSTTSADSHNLTNFCKELVDAAFEKVRSNPEFTYEFIQSVDIYRRKLKLLFYILLFLIFIIIYSFICFFIYSYSN